MDMSRKLSDKERKEKEPWLEGNAESTKDSLKYRINFSRLVG